MSEPGAALLSVRGEARVVVPADYGTFIGAVRVIAATKAEALEIAAVRLRELTEALSSLGGVPLDIDSRSSPLTWSAYSATTEPEHDVNGKGTYRLTGRVIASSAVQVVMRSFGLIDRLSSVLAAHDAFNVRQVTWHANDDNPMWLEVRSSAIRAAIDKARHYAAALGGSLVRVEHIADVGLLGGEGPMHARSLGAAMSAGMPDVPSLDPVPQELVAVIDARFVAEVAAL